MRPLPCLTLLCLLSWMCLASGGILAAADGSGSGASLPAVPQDAPSTPPASNPAADGVGSTTAAAVAPPGPSATAQAAAKLHNPQIDALRALMARASDTVTSEGLAIAKQQKLVKTIDGQIALVKKALADLETLGDQLEAARKAMQTADDRVANEYQQNHDYRTNTGGASQGAIDAQASSQQAYAQLKRETADAPNEIQEGQNRLATLTHQRAAAMERIERYRAEQLTAERAATQAETQIEDIVRALEPATAARAATATGAAVAGAAAATPATPATAAAVQGGEASPPAPTGQTP